MQRLRTTFKRSRTPTGAEMKTQSSLEVPKQVRSASFDEIQLEAKRALQQKDPASGLLTVPTQSQRSKSFDGGGGGGDDPGMFLEVPRGRFQRRRSSGDKSPPVCVHCMYMEEYARLRSPPGEDPSPRSFSYSDTSTEEDIDSDPEPLVLDLEPPLTPQCCITVTLSPNPNLSPTFEDLPSPSTRRRSITSPKLERQEAFIFNENLLEPPSPDEPHEEPPPTPTVTNSVIVSEFFLAVPELKRDRAASVDSCFINKSAGKTEEIPPVPSTQLLLEPPPLGPNALRSRSVDIVLPTDTQARYKALALSNTPTARSTDKGYVVHAPPSPALNSSFISLYFISHSIMHYLMKSRLSYDYHFCMS